MPILDYPDTPSTDDNYITRTLAEQAQRQAEAKALAAAEPVHTVLESVPMGVIRLVEMPEGLLLEYLRIRGRTQYVPLTEGVLEQLAALWAQRQRQGA